MAILDSIKWGRLDASTRLPFGMSFLGTSEVFLNQHPLLYWSL